MQSKMRGKISPVQAVCGDKAPHRGAYEESRQFWRDTFFINNRETKSYDRSKGGGRQPNAKLARRLKRRRCNKRDTIRRIIHD